MSGFSVPNTFADDTKALAAPVNANFTALANAISPGSNGGSAAATGPQAAVPHGLSYTPTQWWCKIVCNSADAGYALNDAVYLGNPLGIAVFNIDATNLYITMNAAANLLQIPHKTTGTLTNITNSKWNVFYYAR